jgi:hypothetical protein
LHSFIKRAAKTKITAWVAQSETVFRAMKLEAVLIDGLAEVEAVHHNNYRALFEAGALYLLPEFLAKRDMAPKAIGDLAFRTHIPIKTMKNWQKTLLKDRDWRPYS